MGLIAGDLFEGVLQFEAPTDILWLERDIDSLALYHKKIV